jgi:hypothetical protein
MQRATRRRLGHAAIKTVRYTSWPLLVVVLTYLATGYAMSGQYGLGTLLDANTAKSFHKLLHAALIVLVLTHSVCATYLAFRRWRWIRW